LHLQKPPALTACLSESVMKRHLIKQIPSSLPTPPLDSSFCDIKHDKPIKQQRNQKTPNIWNGRNIHPISEFPVFYSNTANIFCMPETNKIKAHTLCRWLTQLDWNQQLSNHPTLLLMVQVVCSAPYRKWGKDTQLLNLELSHTIIFALILFHTNPINYLLWFD